MEAQPPGRREGHSTPARRRDRRAVAEASAEPVSSSRVPAASEGTESSRALRRRISRRASSQQQQPRDERRSSSTRAADDVEGRTSRGTRQESQTAEPPPLPRAKASTKTADVTTRRERRLRGTEAVLHKFSGGLKAVQGDLKEQLCGASLASFEALP